MINNFSKFSGLNSNLSKCEILQLQNNNLSTVCNIPVKSMVTYLGIKICKTTEVMVNSNFRPVIEKTQNKYNN